MTKIHEIIPVEQDKVQVANSLVDEGINTFAKKPDHFMGQLRRVEMYDTTREAENTTDVKELVETVDLKLGHIWDALKDAFDVSMAKENSNTSTMARADVTVGGVIVLGDVPATALLALEKRMAQLKNLYTAIPTLDPAYAWDPDPSAAMEGVMRTKHPQEGQKTEKVHDYRVLYEATEHHPAQVTEFTVDKNVAKVTTERQSGMVSPATKARWLKNISDLATAVKQARQRANMAEVQTLPVADDIRAFIHG